MPECQLTLGTNECALKAENQQLREEARRCRGEALDAWARVAELKSLLKEQRNAERTNTTTGTAL